MSRSEASEPVNPVALASASQWNLAQLGDLGDLFMSLDKNKDGNVDMQEALDGLAATALGKRADLAQIVTNLLGPEGSIRYQEFVALLDSARRLEIVSELEMQFTERNL